MSLASSGIEDTATRNDKGIMSDEEYYRRYGHSRGSNKVTNF